MKYICCLLLLAMSFEVFAKSEADFNRALLNDVQKEIKKNDDMFKKKVRRGPASVGPAIDPKIVEPLELDKNVRQIGPNKW